MDLRYSFDKAVFGLGTLCKQGHAWPGTELSLRRIHSKATACAGCTGRKQSDWLLSFLDYETMGWPPGLKLGKLCPGRHQWKGLDATLRTQGRCLECEQDKNIARRKRPPGPRLTRQEQRRICRAKRYEALRSQGLTTRGTVPVRADGAAPRGEGSEAIALLRAIRRAGRSPSVARLVMDEQLRHWREHPDDRAAHDRQWAQASWWLEYQIKPDLRLYHREKSKRRKAQNRGQTPVQIPVAALRQRFNEFGNCCAYCGTGGDMQIEHVEPISKGGAHDIGNIVPACWPCNAGKRLNDMETWYRCQPFFSELRLHRIRRVIRPPEGQQLTLALA
jgi:5-methylcytosine-specific restriction endonuclease McrA